MDCISLIHVTPGVRPYARCHREIIVCGHRRRVVDVSRKPIVSVVMGVHNRELWELDYGNFVSAPYFES